MSQPKRLQFINNTTKFSGSSWWKDLGDNSEDSIAVLQENKDIETNNIMEELNLDVLR